jgi:pimeloyl-ACP methyl ester carboxylesterase
VNGYTANRRDFNKLIWQTVSPRWGFDDATFDRSAAAFDNADHVAIVVHDYRWRMSLAKGEAKYDELEEKLAKLPAISVPTITIASDFDGAGQNGAGYRNKVYRQIRAPDGVLDVGYYESGPRDGPAVLLLHGNPYDVHSFEEVIPLLAARGNRVIVPHLRGHGTPRFVDEATPRSGEQAALGVETVALMDALGIQRPVLAGYDCGGRAACVVAALWPERCSGIVSVNSYLIYDITRAGAPASAKTEWGIWYQFYFLTERGRAGLDASRSDIARILWKFEQPAWDFSDATFARSAAAFDNPDYVDVVIHSYRHRLGFAPGYPLYADLQTKLATLLTIAVPTITMDGQTDGVTPPTDGTSTAKFFTGNVFTEWCRTPATIYLRWHLRRSPTQ